MYDNGDAEDMTIVEIQNHWVKPDEEKKESSTKKKQRTKHYYTLSEKLKINF